MAVHGRREAAAAAAAAARAEAAAAGDERAVRQRRQRAAWAAAVALALPLARLRERVLAARAAAQVQCSQASRMCRVCRVRQTWLLYMQRAVRRGQPQLRWRYHACAGWPCAALLFRVGMRIDGVPRVRGLAAGARRSHWWPQAAHAAERKRAAHFNAGLS